MEQRQLFSDYDIEPEIKDALTMLGYNEPTPIQEEVLLPALQGRDIVGQSQTGSGKTAAFAIPICSRVIWNEIMPQALILEPTRELAVQVQDEIFQIGRKRRLKAAVVFGGMPIDKQTITLKQRNHIVVGTPGRILDHMERENLKLDKVRYLVIDEADLMLDMGFLEDVEKIIKKTGKEQKPQMMLFSATMESHIENLIADYMKNPKRILHALEICTMTGNPYSNLRTGERKKRNFEILKIGLNLPRPELYERINRRVDQMMEAGLLEEASQFYPHKHLNTLNTVGYKEIYAFMDGEWDIETAIGMIKQNSRRYAKRQLTWYNRDAEINWFRPDDEKSIMDLITSQLQIKDNGPIIN